MSEINKKYWIKHSISLEKKLKIIKNIENKIENQVIIKRYGLKNQSNINCILKDKDKYVNRESNK